ncbi:MAG: hypothetical protein K2P38_15570, partial [Lachnospiraceae bacterium]|nr:hypothetical protein [Lachnospiraceae bacterium]
MKKTLTKLTAAGLTAAMAITMAACGGKSQGGENEVDTTQTNFKIFANTSALSQDNSENPLVKQMNEAVGVT